MNMRLLAAATAVAAIAAGLPASAGAGEYSGPGFSGIAWYGENGTADRELGPMHVDRQGFRMELEQDGQRLAVLAYWDRDTAYTLMLDQGVFLEVPAEEAGSTAAEFNGQPCDGYEDARRMGTATVNGRETEKWRCIGEIEPAPGSEPTDSTSWFDPQLGFPVREVKDNGEVFEVRDIAVARQDATLFEIPDGFQELDMNALMQQMMQQRQQSQ